MADIPHHRVITVEKHEWVIGDGERELTARQLRDGIFFAQKEMEELGIDVSYDDAYHVRTGDNEVILYVEKETLS